MQDKIDAARTAALTAYATARAAGQEPAESAQAAWMAARGILRHLRAPYWSEQVWANSGRRRSYRSPLGRVLGVAAHEFGHHSAEWPRTVRSQRESDEAAAKILAHLEQLAATGTQDIAA